LIKQCEDSISYNNVTIKLIKKEEMPEALKESAIKSIEVQNKFLEADIDRLKKAIKSAKEKDAKATTEAYVDTLIELWRD
jgi:hypothetical protein